MSHALIKSEDSVSSVSSCKNSSVLSKEQAADVDAIKAYHTASRKSAEDHIIYSFLCGSRLESLKNSCQHGVFGFLRDTHFPEVSKGAEYRHRETFKALTSKFPTVGNIEPKLLPGPDSDLKAKEKFLSAVHDNFDGKTITAIWRDLGIVKPSKPPTGSGKKLKISADSKNPFADALQELALLCLEDSDAMDRATPKQLREFIESAQFAARRGLDIETRRKRKS